MADAEPRLSLCVIAKNEATRLPRCLASAAGVVDEIVVADTGSTDQTIEVAESAGARVTRFEWCDDFAAAYNHALDEARCDWILLLDADEQLAAQSRASVRALIERESALAYTVLRRDYYGPQRSEHAYTEMLQTRLFRRRDELRFVGRIHQQLEPSLSRIAKAEGLGVLASDVRIDHDGYLGEQQIGKLQRSARLLELELRDRPDRFYYLVELGRTKLAMRDMSGVETLARATELITSGRQPPSAQLGALALLLEQLLAADTLPEGFPMSMGEADALAAEHFPDSIPLLWQRARQRFKTQRFDEAATLLESLVRLADSGAYDRACSFDPRVIDGDALLNLGVSYSHLGRFGDARRCFGSLADHPRHGASARSNLEKLAGLDDA